MKNFNEFTDQDFERLAREIKDISNSRSESELFQIMGNALHDLGYTTSENNSLSIIEPKMLDESIEKFNAIKSLNYVHNTTPLSSEEAINEGGRFWERFKLQLQKAICNDEKIKELLNGEGSIKDYLIVGIPIVTAALGFTTLNPVFLVMIAATFALILKVGFKAYCELE